MAKTAQERETNSATPDLRVKRGQSDSVRNQSGEFQTQQPIDLLATPEPNLLLPDLQKLLLLYSPAENAQRQRENLSYQDKIVRILAFDPKFASVARLVFSVIDHTELLNRLNSSLHSRGRIASSPWAVHALMLEIDDIVAFSSQDERVRFMRDLRIAAREYTPEPASLSAVPPRTEFGTQYSTFIEYALAVAQSLYGTIHSHFRYLLGANNEIRGLLLQAYQEELSPQQAIEKITNENALSEKTQLVLSYALNSENQRLRRYGEAVLTALNISPESKEILRKLPEFKQVVQSADLRNIQPRQAVKFLLTKPQLSESVLLRKYGIYERQVSAFFEQMFNSEIAQKLTDLPEFKQAIRSSYLDEVPPQEALSMIGAAIRDSLQSTVRELGEDRVSALWKELYRIDASVSVHRKLEALFASDAQLKKPHMAKKLVLLSLAATTLFITACGGAPPATSTGSGSSQGVEHHMAQPTAFEKPTAVLGTESIQLSTEDYHQNEAGEYELTPNKVEEILTRYSTNNNIPLEALSMALLVAEPTQVGLALVAATVVVVVATDQLDALLASVPVLSANMIAAQSTLHVYRAYPNSSGEFAMSTIKHHPSGRVATNPQEWDQWLNSIGAALGDPTEQQLGQLRDILDSAINNHDLPDLSPAEVDKLCGYAVMADRCVALSDPTLTKSELTRRLIELLPARGANDPEVQELIRKAKGPWRLKKSDGTIVEPNISEFSVSDPLAGLQLPPLIHDVPEMDIPDLGSDVALPSPDQIAAETAALFKRLDDLQLLLLNHPENPQVAAFAAELARLNASQIDSMRAQSLIPDVVLMDVGTGGDTPIFPEGMSQGYRMLLQRLLDSTNPNKLATLRVLLRIDIALVPLSLDQLHEPDRIRHTLLHAVELLQVLRLSRDNNLLSDDEYSLLYISVQETYFEILSYLIQNPEFTIALNESLDGNLVYYLTNYQSLVFTGLYTEEKRFLLESAARVIHLLKHGPSTSSSLFQDGDSLLPDTTTPTPAPAPENSIDYWTRLGDVNNPFTLNELPELAKFARENNHRFNGSIMVMIGGSPTEEQVKNAFGATEVTKSSGSQLSYIISFASQ